MPAAAVKMLTACLQKETSWYKKLYRIPQHMCPPPLIFNKFFSLLLHWHTDRPFHLCLTLIPKSNYSLFIVIICLYFPSFPRSLSVWMRRGEEAIVISMETAQQQTWSWQPIRVCFGTVSHPMRRAEEAGVQGGVVGCQGEYSGRCEHFLVGLRTSASQSWGEAIFQLFIEVISLVNSVWIENKFTFQQLCRTSGKQLHHLPANKMDCAH